MALVGQSKKSKMIRRNAAFLVFLFGSLLLAEQYPFTRFPMYNSFPNYSYVFYLSDVKNHPIPLSEVAMVGGELAHHYFAIANAHGFSNGNNLETRQHLQQIGKEMARMIRQKKPNFTKKFLIHRLYFFKQNNQLKKQDRVIYTTP